MNELKDFEQPSVTVDIVIFTVVDDDLKVLLVKRAQDPFKGKWALPGGFVRIHESIDNAAKRELLEECGVECDLKKLSVHYQDFPEKGKLLRYFVGMYLGKYAGDIQLNEEATEFKRMSVFEIQKRIEEDPNQFTPGFVKDFELIKDKLI